MSAIRQQIVWITGASSGIGESLTYEMAKLNNILIISSRRENELQKVAEKALQLGAKSVKIQALDLGNETSFETIVSNILQEFGKIDILFNNGGISQRSKALETSLEVDRKLMEVDYFGTIALTKLLLPSMVKNKSGHIVITSSLVGKFGTPYRTAYSAAKHALHGYFEALRAELWDYNIKVTICCPGFIKTLVSVNAMVGDGKALNEMDNAQANGMHPDECAKQMVRAVERNKFEVLIGGKEILGVYIKRFFPNLWVKMLRKLTVR